MDKDVNKAIRPEPTLSPAKAVLWGHLFVTVPGLTAMAVGTAVWFWSGGTIPGLLYVFVGLSVAQLWMSVVVHRWWAWVRRSGVDQERTRALARRACLISGKRFLQIASDASTGRVRRILKLLAPSVITLVAGLVVSSYLGPITALVYVKWQGRTHPEMWVVPTPLPEPSAGQWEGRKFTYFGYEFETPWTELKQERVQESMAILNFTNGVYVSFWDPTQRFSEIEVVKQEGLERGVDISFLFGEKAMQSNYEFLSKTLYLTPTDLTLSLSGPKMMGDSIFLIWKGMRTGRLKGGLYSFRTTWLRGFQMGNPSVDKPTIAIAYDAEDQKYEFWIGSGEDANASQTDVSRILYSLRPVPASQ